MILDFKYYLNITDCYINMGIANDKINELRNSNNVYDKIQLGILYIKTGEKSILFTKDIFFK